MLSHSKYLQVLFFAFYAVKLSSISLNSSDFWGLNVLVDGLWDHEIKAIWSVKVKSFSGLGERVGTGKGLNSLISHFSEEQFIICFWLSALNFVASVEGGFKSSWNSGYTADFQHCIGTYLSLHCRIQSAFLEDCFSTSTLQRREWECSPWYNWHSTSDSPAKWQLSLLLNTS